MRKPALYALSLMPLIALGGPAAVSAAQAGNNPREEQNERRHRMLLLVGISEAMGLSNADAVQVDAILQRFDDRRRPLRHEVQASLKMLERATEGDAVALAQVDQLTNRIFENRSQQAALDKEEYAELAKSRSPQQRAKLGIFLARFRARPGMANVRRQNADATQGAANDDDR